MVNIMEMLGLQSIWASRSAEDIRCIVTSVEERKKDGTGNVALLVCFMADPFTDGQKYKCQDCVLGTKNKVPYPEYLKTDHWQIIKGEALERAKRKCQLCSSKRRLEVHHNTYDHLWCELPEDVIALCSRCHKKHHGLGELDVL